MKVLQINSINGIRSTGRFCYELADYLNKSNIDGYIAYSIGTPYEKGYMIGSLIEKKLHGLLSRILGTQAYFSKKGTRKLLNYMDELKPDIVHIGNLHSNYINLILLLSYLARNDIATVITLHDCWFYTGKCCHYTVQNCFKWQSECHNCPRIRRDNKSWFFDRSKMMYHDKKRLLENIPRLAIVGISDWLTNEAMKSFLTSANIITRIYNWIDLDIFRPVSSIAVRRKMGLENKFIILGVASSWSNAKGLDKFIELSEKISNNMIIILVGNISAKVNIPNNIIHIDETHNTTELVEYYSMADVFVNLSLEETFGNVTAEALACGTPAIVLNSTANPELIGDGCGYVVGKNDYNKVKEHIADIYKRGKGSYSAQCIAYAKNNFSKDRRIFDYINLYKKLISVNDN